MLTLQYRKVAKTKIGMVLINSSRYFFSTLAAGLGLSSIVIVNTSVAQVIPDSTLGNESSIVNNSAEPNTKNIDGGAIRDENLFHSFQEFNIEAGQTVNFNNPEGIAHIFGRVTGNNPSEILGTLGVLGSADLFLLNPNGILFGQSSSLDINGSFVATSASSVHFADGSKFATTNIPDKPLLTVSTPIGLGFEQPPRTIVSRASLNITDSNINTNNTLALVGGDILFQGGSIETLGGRTELASAAIDDFISLSQVNNRWILGDEGLKQGKNIRLTTGFNSENNQVSSIINIISIFGNTANFQLSARNLTIDDGQINTITFDDTPIENLSLNVLDTIQLNNNRFNPSDSRPITSTLGIAAFSEIDNQGEINISTKKLIVGKGGIIEGSFSEVRDQRTGDFLGFTQGGNIRINASELVEIKDGGAIQTNSINFENSGNISITSPKVIINNQGRISADFVSPAAPNATFSAPTGDDGNITIISDSLEISNNSTISSNTNSSDTAGTINIFTKNLTLQNEGEITANSIGEGVAGDLNIQAESLLLDNNSSLSVTTTQSNGGNINLAVEDNITLRNQSNISASVGGKGNGGNVNIDAEFVIALPEENSDITANAESGDAGNIFIEASDVIGIQFREQVTELSDITVSSDLGLEGTVVVRNPDTLVEQTVTDTTPDVIDANNIFSNNYCKINQNSNYIVTGRGGLPLASQQEMLPEYLWEDWRIIDEAADSNLEKPSTFDQKDPTVASENNSSNAQKINSVQGWTVNQQGQIVLTANSIMVTPHAATKNPGCS